MEMIARTALIATDDPHDWDPGIDALEWRNKTQWRIIKLSYQSISPQHHQSLNLCMNYLFNDTFYLLTITHVLCRNLFTKSVCFDLLTNIVTLTFFKSVTSLHNPTLSTVSPWSQDHRKECVGLWSQTDGDLRTGRAYWGQESTLETDCLYSTGCLYCAVCNALYRHSTRHSTDAARGHTLIWFRGLLWDYIELFVRINKTQLALK